MSKLPSYSLVLMVFVVLIHENIALRSRNSFQSALSHCNGRCRFLPGLPPLPPSRRNDVKKCLTLEDHDDSTVGLCAAGCLEERIGNLGNASTCDCRNSKCISSPTTTTSTTTSTSPTSSVSTTASTSTSTIAGNTPTTSSTTTTPAPAP